MIQMLSHSIQVAHRFEHVQGRSIPTLRCVLPLFPLRKRLCEVGTYFIFALELKFDTKLQFFLGMILWLE